VVFCEDMNTKAFILFQSTLYKEGITSDTCSPKIEVPTPKKLHVAVQYGRLS